MPLKSETTEAFRRQFAAAPTAVQTKIRAAYALWSENPNHPSPRFKKVHDKLPIYSARVDLNWRAVGVMKQDTVRREARAHDLHHRPAAGTQDRWTWLDTVRCANPFDRTLRDKAAQRR